jgi:hypothetical protein
MPLVKINTILILSVSVLAGCTTLHSPKSSESIDTHIASEQPLGLKLTTIEYTFDAKRMGQKRLLAILKSKANNRFPNKELVLFNLNISHDNSWNRVGEKLRSHATACSSTSNASRRKVSVGKGDEYQTQQSTMSCSSVNYKKTNQLRVASVDIYLAPAPEPKQP